MNAQRRPKLDEVRFRHENKHFADQAGRRIYKRIFSIGIVLGAQKLP
jgi:hypothetical protein